MSVDWSPCSNGPPESGAKSRWAAAETCGGRPGKGADDRVTHGRGASRRIARGCLRDVGIPRVSPGLLSLASGDIVEAVPYAPASKPAVLVQAASDLGLGIHGRGTDGLQAGELAGERRLGG